MKYKERVLFRWANRKEISTVVACLASMMLTGIPPQVCESVLDEVYCSLRKSVEKIVN